MGNGRHILRYQTTILINRVHEEGEPGGAVGKGRHIMDYQTTILSYNLFLLVVTRLIGTPTRCKGKCDFKFPLFQKSFLCDPTISCFISKRKNIPIDSGGGGGGGGANTKVPDMYGVGGVFTFRDPKHKSNMYTFVKQRGGGVSIFYPESQKYKWYFCTHIS